MVASFVQVPPDSTGKQIATNEVGGKQYQIVNLADEGGNAIAPSTEAWQPDFSELERERDARARFREKQDEIVELRLEAQDLLLRKHELAAEATKQALRQRRALELEYQNLQLEIERQLILLKQLEQLSIKRKKTVLMLLLAAGSPLTPLAIN